VRILLVALRALIFTSSFVFVWGWLALSVRLFDRRIGLTLPEWATMPGMIVTLIGGILALICIGVLVVQGRGTPALFDAPRAFVAIGPYRYIRNPMSVGGFTMLVGLGLYERSISILLFAFVWLFFIHFIVVCLKEPGLRKRFGARGPRKPGTASETGASVINCWSDWCKHLGNNR
jgi:protein-S-isoprenylcysteine O-methyltransferase Ste14